MIEMYVNQQNTLISVTLISSFRLPQNYAYIFLRLSTIFAKRKQSCIPRMSLDGNNWCFTWKFDHKLELSQ